MTGLDRAVALLWSWLDLVAAALTGGLERLTTRRTVRLIETEPGKFAVEDGRPTSTAITIGESELAGEPSPAVCAVLRRSAATLVLHSSRFIFRPLELPDRAADFLDGIVRSQIDRLTPWTPAEAAFGWSAPVTVGQDRITVTVAATARTQITRFVTAVAAAGGERVTVQTKHPGDTDAPAINILDEKSHGLVDAARVRRVLAILLVTLGVAALGALGAAAAASVVLGQRQEDLERTIAARRAALRAQRDPTTDPATIARRALERRKQETLPGVLVLEAIARVLPDHSWVTEFRIEGDMVRISGFTRDAPALIRLIEQAPEFSNATFYAPTTRAASDPGERFHIEAKIELRSGAPS